MCRTACTEPQCLYSTAIPLLPLWVVRPVQCLSACTRVHLYLYLTLYVHNKTCNMCGTIKTYTLTRRFYEDDRIYPNWGRTSVSAKKKKRRRRIYFSGQLGSPYLWVPIIYIFLLHGSCPHVSDTTCRYFHEWTLQIMKSNINAPGHAVTHFTEALSYKT